MYADIAFASTFHYHKNQPNTCGYDLQKHVCQLFCIENDSFNVVEYKKLRSVTNYDELSERGRRLYAEEN